MPNFFDRIIGRGHMEHALSPLIRDQNLRLQKAGINIGENNTQHLSSYLETLTDDNLSLLGRILTQSDHQAWFFGSRYDYMEAVEAVRKISTFVDNSINDPQIKDQKIRQISHIVWMYTQRCNLIFSQKDAFSDKSYNRHVLALIRIASSPSLYNLFDQDPNKLIEGALKIFNSDYRPEDMVATLTLILANANSPQDVRNFLELPQDEIRLILGHRTVFGSHPEAIKPYERFSQSEGNWGDRYLLFRNLCVAVGGLPLTTQSLSDLLVQRMSPEVRKHYDQKNSVGKFLTLGAIKRKLGHNALRKISLSDHYRCESDLREQLEIVRNIAILENPDLPIVTMNISAPVGSEVEFPYEEEEIYNTVPNDFENLTEELGIHWGGGGEVCAEIAPGPFYHPETMIAYFQMMQDLGFIDLARYQGLTLHFNPGVEEHGLIRLVLAQYLCNTISDPSMFSENSRENGFEFKIYSGKTGTVDDTYTECKSFLCMTPAETVTGLTQVGYLSWALKCYQQSGELRRNRAKIPTRVKQMACIWSDYLNNLNTGSRSVGLSGLFRNDHLCLSKGKLNKLIKLIEEVVPDYRSRFRDPNSVITQNPVTVGERQWSNIVAFARALGNEAVFKIMNLEEEINMEAKNRILEIGQLTGQSKRVKVQEFLKEFKPDKTSLSTFQEELDEIELTASALGLKNVEM